MIVWLFPPPGCVPIYEFIGFPPISARICKISTNKDSMFYDSLFFPA